MKQMSETFAVGAVLTLAGGFLDAYTYIERGGVFANAQTGNIVRFAVELCNGNYRSAAVYIVPIAAFALGILITEFTRSGDEKIMLHWRQMVLIYEIVLLTIVGFMPCGELDMAVNVIISLVCSLQYDAFRKVDGNAYATTMCTGNLRSGSQALYNFIRQGDRSLLKKSLEYYMIIGVFVVGALIGSYVTGILGSRSVWVCSVLLAAVFAMLWK